MTNLPEILTKLINNKKLHQADIVEGRNLFIISYDEKNVIDIKYEPTNSRQQLFTNLLNETKIGRENFIKQNCISIISELAVDTHLILCFSPKEIKILLNTYHEKYAESIVIRISLIFYLLSIEDYDNIQEEELSIFKYVFDIRAYSTAICYRLFGASFFKNIDVKNAYRASEYSSKNRWSEVYIRYEQSVENKNLLLDIINDKDMPDCIKESALYEIDIDIFNEIYNKLELPYIYTIFANRYSYLNNLDISKVCNGCANEEFKLLITAVFCCKERKIRATDKLRLKKLASLLPLYNYDFNQIAPIMQTLNNK